MSYFEKTFNAAVEFNDAMTEAGKVYRSERKTILETYKSPLAENKLLEIQEIYRAAQAEQRKKVKEIVSADFADTRRAVNGYISAPVPADFPDTLTAIQAKGKHISEHESRVFLDKYKGNYLAFSTLVDVLHGFGNASDILPIKPKNIEDEIRELENFVMNWIREHESNGLSYMNALLTSQEHSPILKTGAQVKAFLDGDFLIRSAANEMNS